MIKTVKSSLLEEMGFKNHGFTLREGGVSEGPYESLNLGFELGDSPEKVRENLALFKNFTGVEKPLLRARQVHGGNVVSAKDLFDTANINWTDSPQVEADAMVCGPTDAGCVLAVQTADCAPVLLADPTSGLTAAIHAGWKSTVKGVVRNTVKKLLNMGASQSTLIAAIGPCICLKCYEVEEDVARNFPESSDPIRKKPGKFLLDLGLAVEVSLIGAGLLGKNIDRILDCTCCNQDRYFSHRGSSGECGRQLGFIETSSG